MILSEATPLSNHTLRIVSSEGQVGIFDVNPYLEYEAFRPLKDLSQFLKITNGGYFVEWECGADLSADSIEVNMKLISIVEKK